jgi:hypothetical protein
LIDGSSSVISSSVSRVDITGHADRSFRQNGRERD